VNRSYVSKIEKGVTFIGLEIVGKLAAVLEVEPAERLRRPTRKRKRRQ
jgi:transcriptional regulator with XRE-family HTH domain